MREPLDLHAVLTDPEIRVVVTCGSGGVGKTTTAAAMALYAADAGRKVAVLTIDPARRLAQSLGLGELDNVPRRVQVAPPRHAPGDDAAKGDAAKGDAAKGDARTAAASTDQANSDQASTDQANIDQASTDQANTESEAAGELWAMMLDTSRTFDEMVSSNANSDHARQILDNPFYQTISTSFSGTQEYMAMQKLSQLAGANEYDLIVVDTPPSRSALDFLDAPQRLSSFLDGRMIRLLASPGRGVMRIVGAGFQILAKAVTSVIGGQMLADAANFVQLFEGMFGGFRERAEATYDLLRSAQTAFVVVAVPEPDALREASYFADRLRAEKMPLAGLVLNRTHPPLAELALSTTTTASAELSSSAPLAAAVLAVHADRLTVRNAELRIRARLDRAHPDLPVVEVPSLAFDAHDVPALRTIGRQLGGHG